MHWQRRFASKLKKRKRTAFPFFGLPFKFRFIDQICRDWPPGQSVKIFDYDRQKSFCCRNNITNSAH